MKFVSSILTMYLLPGKILHKNISEKVLIRDQFLVNLTLSGQVDILTS